MRIEVLNNNDDNELLRCGYETAFSFDGMIHVLNIEYCIVPVLIGLGPNISLSTLK